MRKLSSVLAGSLLAFTLFSVMAFQAPTILAAPTNGPSTAHWVTVRQQTLQLSQATCDRIKAKIHAATGSQPCIVTESLMILRDSSTTPFVICCGGGGGCTWQSTGWKQYFEFATLPADYYYQQTGTFNYNGCNTPTDSGHNCTRNMSYSPGTTVSNTYCGDYTSGGKAVAEGDYLVAIFGLGSTSTLTATCDVYGNISDPSLVAD